MYLCFLNTTKTTQPLPYGRSSNRPRGGFDTCWRPRGTLRCGEHAHRHAWPAITSQLSLQMSMCTDMHDRQIYRNRLEWARVLPNTQRFATPTKSPKTSMFWETVKDEIQRLRDAWPMIVWKRKKPKHNSSSRKYSKENVSVTKKIAHKNHPAQDVDMGEKEV